MKRRIVIWILALAVLAIVTTVAVRWMQQVGRPVEVRVASARIDEITDVIVARGMTVPVEQVDITTNLEARIVSVSVDVGDSVVRGSYLAQLDRTSYADMHAKAIAERDNAQRAYDDAAATLRRLEDSFARGIATQEDMDEARRVMVDAEGRLELAKIDADMRRLDLYHTTITSPIKGIVSARNVNQGEMVGEGGRVLFTIDSREISFRAYIDEEETGRLRAGQQGEITLAAFPERVFTGQITKINPTVSAEPTSTGFPIWINLSGPEGLVPGLSGYVKIRQTQTTLVIPLPALVYFSANHGLVFVVEGAFAHLRPVVYGTTGDGKVEIISGLVPGDRVVIEGHEELEDGDEVVVLD